MKKNFILIILFLFFLQHGKVYAQSTAKEKKAYEIAKGEAIQSISLYIASSKKRIDFSHINQKNIRKLLGSPITIKIETGGVDTYKVFSYRSGEIYFNSNGSFDSFEIKNDDWKFIFKSNNKLLAPVTIGTDRQYLLSKFPYQLSHRENPKNPFFIRLLDKDGTINPYETIDVKFSKDKVSSIMYTFNNY